MKVSGVYRMSYEIIDVNTNNLDTIGLFCKQSQKKETGYQNKLEWIKARFLEGLKYKILKVKETNKYSYRGFIEYIPSEFNWRGIEADNFMVIHCLWVVGRHKGKGYASELIQYAIDDAKHLKMNGVVGISATKSSYPRKKIFEKMGFKKVDEAGDGIFSLHALSFLESVTKPSFFPISSENIPDDEGVTVLYTHQCPYSPQVIKDVEEFADINEKAFRSKLVKTVHETKEKALHPYGSFCIYCDGKVIPYKAGLKKLILKK